jgi:hypothetical protein
MVEAEELPATEEINTTKQPNTHWLLAVEGGPSQLNPGHRNVLQDAIAARDHRELRFGAPIAFHVA